MNLLGKVFIGAGVVAVAGVVAIAVADKSEENAAKKAIEFAVDDKVKQELKDKEDERKEKSVFCRIKRYVEKKVIKILGFVALHMEQIEAASAVIGLASGVIGIASAVKEYRRGDDVQDKLDALTAKVDRLTKQEMADTHALGTYIQDCTEVLNDNLKQTDADIIYFAEKQGVKILEDGEVFTA